MADDIKQIIEDEEFPKEVDEFIDGLIEEGYDIEDIEAVLTDDDFLAKLDDLDAENEEDEDVEQLDEVGKEKLGRYMNKAIDDLDVKAGYRGLGVGRQDAGPEERKAYVVTPKHLTQYGANDSRKRRAGLKMAVKKLSKEETETMMKDISKGKLGFGKVTPILSNAAYHALLSVPESERADVIESIYNDAEKFRLLITSKN